MHVIIIGAGEVGKQLARVLSVRKNDVVVIDMDDELLEQLKDKMDIMTIGGNGATARNLLRAGVEKAELLLAVTNNSEANILACTLAKQFNVPKKFARIRSNEYFDAGRGLATDYFGIDYAIIPEWECANGIFDALVRPAVKETVKFSHPDAQMVNFLIKPGSPMIGARLSDFPRVDFLQNLRICAILRYGQLIIPRGNASFLAFDEVYVAGDQTVIDEMIAWADPQKTLVDKVILAGATPLAMMLGGMLSTADMRIFVIEPNAQLAQKAASMLGSGATVLHGESTDISVLEEAGIEHCHAFIASHADNETNVLSCILAKRHGAHKVIAVTNHPDYIRIIAGMNMIDCAFSPLVSAVNILIQHISGQDRRTLALLKRVQAEVVEFVVQPKSAVAGKRISDIDCPPDSVFCLILRDSQLVAATGAATLQVGDHVAMLVRLEAENEVDKLFMPKGGWG